MNKQGLIAIFAVSLLLISALSVLASQADGVTDDDWNLSTVQSSEQIPIVEPKEVITEKENGFKTYIATYEPAKQNYTSITSQKIIIDENAEICSIETTIVEKDGTLATNSISIDDPELVQFVADNAISLMNVGFVDRITETLEMILELAKADLSLIGNTVKEKITKFLAKTAVQKIITKVGLAWIPAAGLVSLGLLVYDLYSMYDEVKEIYDLYLLERNGYEWNPGTNELTLAEGKFGKMYTISTELATEEVCESKKEKDKNNPQYSLAFINLADRGNGKIYISKEKIPDVLASAILKCKNCPEIGIYTYYEENAKGAFGKLANMTPTDEPDTDEQHSKMHIDHYHAANKSSGFEVHSFFGMPI